VPGISYAETADLDSVYADEDRAPLIETTQSDQAGRYAEILWLEQKLSGRRQLRIGFAPKSGSFVPSGNGTRSTNGIPCSSQM
jgi:hypothetical protein